MRICIAYKVQYMKSYKDTMKQLIGFLLFFFLILVFFMHFQLIQIVNIKKKFNK